MPNQQFRSFSRRSQNEFTFDIPIEAPESLTEIIEDGDAQTPSNFDSGVKVTPFRKSKSSNTIGVMATKNQ